MDSQIEIYKVAEGEVIFNVDAEHETLWATAEQMAELFSVTPRNIRLHLSNIYETQELDEKRTRKDSFQVRTEGKRQVTRKVNFYNLDAIISVGYRVNSKKATTFRQWATKVLHGYVTDGIAINQPRLEALNTKKLQEVEGMLGVVRRLMDRQALDAGEANGILEVISRYSGSWQMLKEYDEGHIDLSGLSRTRRRQVPLDLDTCLTIIDNLRASTGAGELFGKPRDDSFAGSLSAIYQSYDGHDLYPTVAEKAAHLLYFVIKDHPFYDGNKRIGALLFIMFLTVNDCHLTKNGDTKISDRALTALALLIAESEPEEKQLIVSLVQKLLE